MSLSAIRYVLCASTVMFAVWDYKSVNGEYETVTQGSLFTTRTWMRNNVAKSPEEFMEKVVSKGCSHKYTTTCLKLDVVGFVDRLSTTENYQIIPGIVIVKENNTSKFPPEMAAALAKEHPNDIDARLDAFLVKRVAQYLNSHSVNFKLFDPENYASARKFAEQNMNFGVGRKGGGLGGLGGGGGGFGGGKDKGGMGMLMAAGMMMASTLAPIAMGAIAALAGKAIMTALMSLLLSAAIALKGLGGSKGVHYEIIQKPVYSHSHTHSSEVQHVEHGHGGGGGGGGGGHGGGGHGGGGGGGGSHDYGHSSYGRSFDTEGNKHNVEASRIIPLSEKLRGGRSMDEPFVPVGVVFSADATQRNGGGDVHEMAYSAHAPQV